MESEIRPEIRVLPRAPQPKVVSVCSIVDRCSQHAPQYCKQHYCWDADPRFRAKQHHWLGINLVGTKANRDAVGARTTYQAGDLKRHRMKVGGGSFLSSHDPRTVLGLGERTKLDWLEIKWPLPSKATERFTNLPVDRYITIVEGEPKWK